MRTTLLIVFTLLVGITMASASIIYVSGSASGTWSADTVVVTSDTSVPAGHTLTIEPGVKVLFQTYCKISVDSSAIVYANGTPGLPILFDDLVDGTHWRGFRFWYASNQTRFSNCHFKHGLASGDFGSTNTYGGALYCSYSYITVYNCVFDSCAAAQGSAIYLNHSNAQILRSIIYSNETQGSSQTGAAGIKCYYSNPIIIENLLINNSSGGSGGALWCYASNPILESNLFAGNSAVSGGAIMASESVILTIHDNTFIQNHAISGSSAPTYGGAIKSSSSELHLDHNRFVENDATSVPNTGYGGAVFASGSNLQMVSNSFIGNSATHVLNGAGGIYLENNTVMSLKNSILWDNQPGQIYVEDSNASVTYSDVQGGWTGSGNIAQQPQFLDTLQVDYRLRWGSPCIDSGDPSPIYNDFDGTRADMGAFFYDQSSPVRITLTSQETPYLLPAQGGDLEFAIKIYNRDQHAQAITFWGEVILPNGSVHGPLFGPITFTAPPGILVSRMRTQRIPETASMGVYYYRIRGSSAGNPIEDSFLWGKLAAATGGSDWSNFGEDFPTEAVNQPGEPLGLKLIGNQPNPFNPSTVIRYELGTAGLVNLTIYDLSGKKVAELVAGIREAGTHEVTFNGSNLPSGIYFCRLQAGATTNVQKMVLMK